MFINHSDQRKVTVTDQNIDILISCLIKESVTLFHLSVTQYKISSPNVLIVSLTGGKGSYKRPRNCRKIYMSQSQQPTL